MEQILDLVDRLPELLAELGRPFDIRCSDPVLRLSKLWLVSNRYDRTGWSEGVQLAANWLLKVLETWTQNRSAVNINSWHWQWRADNYPVPGSCGRKKENSLKDATHFSHNCPFMKSDRLVWKSRPSLAPSSWVPESLPVCSLDAGCLTKSDEGACGRGCVSSWLLNHSDRLCRTPVYLPAFRLYTKPNWRLVWSADKCRSNWWGVRRRTRIHCLLFAVFREEELLGKAGIINQETFLKNLTLLWCLCYKLSTFVIQCLNFNTSEHLRELQNHSKKTYILLSSV